MANLTPKQWADKMTAQFNKLDKALITTITDTVAETTTRIFERGLNSRNMVIGTYSQKPIYVNPDNSPKSFAVFGKSGGTIFKNGKPHKTRYFKFGYKSFKGVIGRGTKVNLQLFEELKGDASAVQLVKINGGHGWFLKKDINIKKLKGLQKRFMDPIFDLTKKEKKNFIEVLQFETRKILNG